MLAHYGMYAQFAKRLNWRSTLGIFEAAARAHVDDPKSAARSVRSQWRADALRELQVLRVHGLFANEPDDERLVRELMLTRERSNFYAILLHVYAEDEAAYADMVSHDPAELEAFGRQRAEGGVLLTGPHIGPFHGLIPLLATRAGLGELHEVMMYRNRVEWQLMRRAYELSGMPEAFVPVLVDPEQIFERSVEALRAGACVGMLSDTTQPGRGNGQFRARLFGHALYAPSGPIRIAHAAQRPVFSVAILPRKDGGLHLHLREAYRPSAEPLDDATIQAALDAKWAQFEDYVRLAPLAWYPIGSLGMASPEPPAATS
ncbi:hypothetical protein G6O69_20160 [Pseudenhygromyxa sp. WMMC2535]|uniref:hypothetical protein n=1 Tax=Pseudenhygromyxa sp. WMMC2535 TaxID=2712867 RepID=UPI001595242E|nr:hypothetical protein [Pseudenhygromyxa sp. WMMC2535]NVB40172.1 hypothetical protein [Pseudenhygromyxa sp. WMMC2535]